MEVLTRLKEWKRAGDLKSPPAGAAASSSEDRRRSRQLLPPGDPVERLREEDGGLQLMVIGREKLKSKFEEKEGDWWRGREGTVEEEEEEEEEGGKKGRSAWAGPCACGKKEK